MKDIKTFINESKETDNQFIKDVKARYGKVKDPRKVSELKVGDIVCDIDSKLKSVAFMRITKIDTERLKVSYEHLKMRRTDDNGCVASSESDTRRKSSANIRNGKLEGKFGSSCKLWDGKPVYVNKL